MIFDIIAGVFATLIIAVLGSSLLLTRKKYLSALSSIIQINIEKQQVLTKFAEVSQELENKKLEDSDGFVKFLSESRDYAFQYIELVQSALDELDVKMAKHKAEYLDPKNKMTLDKYRVLVNNIYEDFDGVKKILPEKK